MTGQGWLHNWAGMAGLPGKFPRNALKNGGWVWAGLAGLPGKFLRNLPKTVPGSLVGWVWAGLAGLPGKFPAA